MTLLNKTITLSFLISTSVFAETNSNKPININIDDKIKNTQSVDNTPLKTGGAVYDSNEESGLDEYNAKTAEMKRKSQMAIQAQRYKKMQEAQKMLETKNNQISSQSDNKSNFNNSNQDYFDRINGLKE